MSRRRRTPLKLLVLVVLLIWMLAQLARLQVQPPAQLPSLNDVRHRSHAVTKHGDDALQARADLDACGDHLHVKLCRRSALHGLTVVFWCEPPGVTICPGMYTTISGLEKTAFLRPCDQWRNCR